jgi:hypothetical protein
VGKKKINGLEGAKTFVTKHTESSSGAKRSRRKLEQSKLVFMDYLISPFKDNDNWTNIF